MDYHQAPLSELFRGPLLHTPQGIICVAGSALSVCMGLAYFVVPPSVADWPMFRAGPLLLAWPVLLFLFFVKTSNSDFAPSVYSSLFVGTAGIAPFVYPYIKEYVA